MDMSRTPQEREQIRERFAAGRDEEISDAERRRMNNDFVQIYPKGWARMRALLRDEEPGTAPAVYLHRREHRSGRWRAGG